MTQVHAAAMPIAARMIELEAGRPSNPEYADLDFPQGISLACRHHVAR